MKQGGKRIGSGRKSKAEELRVPEILKSIISDNDLKSLFGVIFKEAMNGSAPQQKMILEYRLGKPMQYIHQETSIESKPLGIKEIVIYPASAYK